MYRSQRGFGFYRTGLRRKVRWKCASSRAERSVVLLGLGFRRSCKLALSCFWRRDLLQPSVCHVFSLKAGLSGFVAMQQAAKDLGENEAFRQRPEFGVV